MGMAFYHCSIQINILCIQIKKHRVSALSKGGISIHTNPVIMIARC